MPTLAGLVGLRGRAPSPGEGASSCHVITWTKYQARDEQKCSAVNQLRMAPAGARRLQGPGDAPPEAFLVRGNDVPGAEHELDGPVDAEGRDEQPPLWWLFAERDEVRCVAPQPRDPCVFLMAGARALRPGGRRHESKSCEHAEGDRCDQTTCHLCPFLSLSLIPNDRVPRSARSRSAFVSRVRA